MRWQPSQIIREQGLDVSWWTNTELSPVVLIHWPNVRLFKNKWTKIALVQIPIIVVLSTQKRLAFSLSFVRDMICLGQIYILSDVIKTALWQRPDLAPDVCLSCGQMASGASILAPRSAFIWKTCGEGSFTIVVIPKSNIIRRASYAKHNTRF